MAQPMNYAQPAYGEWRQPEEIIRPVIGAVTVRYCHLTGKKAILLEIGAAIPASRCRILTIRMNI